MSVRGRRRSSVPRDGYARAAALSRRPNCAGVRAWEDLVCDLLRCRTALSLCFQPLTLLLLPGALCAFFFEAAEYLVGGDGVSFGGGGAQTESVLTCSNMSVCAPADRTVVMVAMEDEDDLSESFV